VGRSESRHAVIERAVGELCQRLRACACVGEDILSTCYNKDDMM